MVLKEKQSFLRGLFNDKKNIKNSYAGKKYLKLYKPKKKNLIRFLTKKDIVFLIVFLKNKIKISIYYK
jgi:hypothetical protein